MSERFPSFGDVKGWVAADLRALGLGELEVNLFAEPRPLDVPIFAALSLESLALGESGGN